MTSLGYVFAFTERRAEVAKFYSEVLGIPVAERKDDSVWFGTEGARFAVHDADDQETAADVRAGSGFVAMFQVDDVDAAYERARAAGAVVGERFPTYFFARDPEGRFVNIGPRRRQ